MGNMIRTGVVVAFVVLAAIIAAGCGSDKGTGPETLSKEAQFDTLTAYLSFEPEDGGEDVVSMLLGQLMPEFWDGIDESDFASRAGSFTPGVSASAKLVAMTDTSLSYSYDPVGGWWYVDFRMSGIDDFFSIISSTVIKDSVRFETEDGTPQMIPDEATTHRVLQKASVAFYLGAGDSGNSVELDLGMTSNLDAAGLNTSAVNVNGNGTYTVGIAAEGDEGTVDMTVAMQSNWDDVTLANPDGQEVCPISGDISGGFTLDMSVVEGTHRYEAAGDWNVGILFTGNGNTTVNVQSGDFQESFSGNVCSE